MGEGRRKGLTYLRRISIDTQPERVLTRSLELWEAEKMDRCEKKLVIVLMRNVKFFHMFHLSLKIKVQKVKKTPSS